LADRPNTDALPGVTSRPDAPRARAVELVGAGVALLWLAVSTLHALNQGAGAAGPVATVLVIVLPVAMIWVGVVVTRTAWSVRAETERLGHAVDALRQAYVAQSQQGRPQLSQPAPPSPALMQRLDEIAAAQAALEHRLTMLASAQIVEGTRSPDGPAQDPNPDQQPEPEAPHDQPALLLDDHEHHSHPPLSNADFIRALHFPETAEDEAGFAALRSALKDRQTAQLVQAAQDVLTLLSQVGVYMDDLSPDLARPEQWRAFAHGLRGREIAALGGVHDREALAQTAARMKQDPIFRDAAHHFLRRFDRVFAAFEDRASDAELTAFAGTRTARAFMLLGRVAGTFD
jgi:hypothetical protein